ncbi:dTMP kinase [Fimbriiglobus ruber]|uniref:Thymidylate kinase n=1 Tax=Fimbriiglobus ruber TaxID=1908690 RepID=A0A225D8R0_9BACT|nr:dTMP kinase [Fimbriiglobus ruber]OWK37842.1 Thymidylate kinase [Fimbriiglobus ruber]
MKQGAFVVFEGYDGTGKSTQCLKLAEWLRGQGATVTACADPGGTELALKLREVLQFGRQHAISLQTEALLFMASRAEMVDQIIRPAIGRGEVVISDRFLLSNIVYQGYAGKLDPELLWQAGQLSTGGLESDLTIILDMSVEIAKTRRRSNATRIDTRGEDFHNRVRDGFLATARRKPETHRVVNADASIDTVHGRVCDLVVGLLRSPQV